ncbi:MAG TPA: hypothetical protein VNA66_08600 [Gammaproteobacteria bacterium]|nr:hypothetical protein [Gammaproteobacteria bacterium]
MNHRSRFAFGAALALTLAAPAVAQSTSGVQASEPAWLERTSWGDPDFAGEWTSEGEFGVPFERPAQFGTQAFLTDEEYAKRLEDVRARDERDLAPVDVFSANVEGRIAPIPHWREYNTDSRRTSLVIDPPDGRLPARTPQSAPYPVPQRCGSLLGGEPCDSYKDYNLGVRCIVHGGGLPDAMFPAVYNANLRIVQSPGYVVITYELIHDTRIIPIDDARPALSPAIRTYMGDSRGHWEGNTLVVETSNLKATTRGASPELRLVERFTRMDRSSMAYEVTFADPDTWTAPWTAAVDLKARPGDAGVYEYACHEGNFGMANMLSTARHLERNPR